MMRRDAASTVVGLASLVAGVLILSRASGSYFAFDEWSYWTARHDFLAAGDVKSLGHFFASPHNGHLHAVTMLTWLPTDWVFGMHRYLPYAIPTLAVHLASGWLLFALLRRVIHAGVAAGAAAVFLVGSASTLIVVSSGWMVGFTLGVAACFAVLLMHIRSTDVTAWKVVVSSSAVVGVAILGGAVGFIALVVAIGSFAIRGAYRSAAQVVGLTVTPWLVWRLLYPTGAGTGGAAALGPSVDTSAASDYLSYFVSGFVAAAGDLVAGLQPLSIVLLGGALWSVVWAARTDLLGRQVVVPAAMGAVFFYAITAVRGVGLDSSAYTADQPRYRYVAAALLLIVIAWLVNRLIERSPAFTVLAIALVALTLGSQWTIERTVGSDNRDSVAVAASFVDALAVSPHGVLVADGSARIEGHQLRRLHDLGKLPCAVDQELAAEIAVAAGIAPPDELRCD